MRPLKLPLCNSCILLYWKQIYLKMSSSLSRTSGTLKVKMIARAKPYAFLCKGAALSICLNSRQVSCLFVLKAKTKYEMSPLIVHLVNPDVNQAKENALVDCNVSLLEGRHKRRLWCQLGYVVSIHDKYSCQNGSCIDTHYCLVWFVLIILRQAYVHQFLYKK